MNNVLDSNKQEHDLDLDFRPKTLKDYVGQSKLKESLEIYIKAAKIRGVSLDHILLYGPPGLGKTTLATIVSNEMNVNILTASGPSIEKTGDLVGLLSDLSEGDVLFIDEIHRIPRYIEEILYSAMEDRYIDIIIGKENASRSVRIDLPNFTLIGATTRVGDLSAPLRDRFGIIYHLEYYNINELEAIISKSANILKAKIDDGALRTIANASRGTPRICNRLLKRVFDFAVVLNEGKIDIECCKKAFIHLDISSSGLDKDNRDYLLTLYHIFNGGPVGAEALAAQMNVDRETLEDVYEPYLLKEGLIKRTSRGRMILDKAIKYIKEKTYD